MHRLLAVALAFLFLTGAAVQAPAIESAGGYYDLGVFAYEDGNFQEAEGHFKEALKADPENPVYLHYLGRVYLEIDRYVEAKEYLEPARDKDPDLHGLNYDLGLLFYKIEQYGMASEHFAAAADEDQSNVLAAYYGGISFYRQKRYTEAGPLFEQSAMNSPSLKVNATYYAGVCDYHNGDLAAAEEKFTYVKENARSSNEKKNAEKMLGIIGREEQQKRYAVELRLHYIYDDNVPLDPTGDEALYADDADSGIYGYAMGSFNIVNRRDFVFGAAVARGQTWYSDLTEFDYSDTNADIYASYATKSFRFGLSYVPRLYTIDGDDYLLEHKIQPRMHWMPNRDMMARLVYNYYLKDYRQNDDRYGDLNEVFADLYYQIFQGRGFIYGGLGYESSTSDDEGYNFTRSKIKAGMSVEVAWKVIVDLEFYYYMKEYPDYPGEKREDDKYSGIVALKRPVYWDWLIALAEYNHTTNDSNVDRFEYESNQFRLGLEVKF